MVIDLVQYGLPVFVLAHVNTSSLSWCINNSTTDGCIQWAESTKKRQEILLEKPKKVRYKSRFAW